MSTQELNTAPTEQEVQANEREYWKQRADLMGIQYAKNITLEKLKELVQQKMAEPVGTKGRVTVEKYAPEVAQMRDNALSLVRFKIRMLDPMKQGWTGMWVTVGNDNLTPIKRAIYFIDEPWHAERIIVEYLKSMHYYLRPMNQIQQKGQPLPRTAKKLPMFEITELPPLTEEELKALAEQQQANGTGQQLQEA